MRLIPTALLASFVVATACKTRQSSLGPVPDKPLYTISITIESIPSGADVFAIESDGQLGARLGTTPFVYTCGLAPRFKFWNDTQENLVGYAEAFGWGAGATWRQVGGQKKLNLAIALAKGSHSLGVASKEIWTYGEQMNNKHVALTVPLKTLDQVNREMDRYVRQQAANSRQHITIQQQRDTLGSINSGLDALIKLQGLGVTIR